MTTFSWALIQVEPPPVGLDDTQIYSAIQQARLSMLVDTAEGDFLTTVGQNYGIPRANLVLSDAMYRRVIRILAWQPKTILFAVYGILTAVFGSQADIIATSVRPWRVYEVNANEIIIELPFDLIAATNEIASYLHGASGYGFVTGGPTNIFTAVGDLSVASATTLVGKNVRFNTTPGVWTDYTVTVFSYSSITGLSTVTVSAATLPTGGGFFYIEIAGDGVDSYRGDYLASGGVASTFTTAAGPPTSTLLAVGDITQGIDIADPVLVSNGTTVISTTVVSRVYAVATNITTVVIVALVPGGLTAQTIVRELELADTTTTPDHDDRVYLTGNGLYDVVEFYMDLVVRAAGIVVRLELI